MLKSCSLLLAITLVSTGIYGQINSTKILAASNPSAGSVPFFPLADLKEGMKGTARTVFRGSEPEEFNVEILGILPGGVGPKQDLIVGKLSGGGADRTSVFAGMSGSPVYIDGKLVGAISYSFPFSKEPICGITPIEQMVAIFEQKQPARTQASEPRAFSFTQMAATKWEPSLPFSADEFGRLIQRLGTTERLYNETFARNYEDAPTETPSAGAIEVWRVFNTTGDTHPIHFHLVNVQIISRQAFRAGRPRFLGPPRPPDANELGWKETVRMNPGECTTVIMKFDLPSAPFAIPASPRTGGHEYVWHCHILEHEEHDMMRPLVVI